MAGQWEKISIEEIFNGDETELFFKALPQRTLKFKGLNFTWKIIKGAFERVDILQFF
jgi:hypothetical protein